MLKSCATAVTLSSSRRGLLDHALLRLRRLFKDLRMPAQRRQLRSPRHFEHLSAPRPGTNSKLTILQWNTLADGLAQFGNFHKVPPRVLQWEHRAPLLLEEIAAASADIIALQEINHFGDFFQPELAKLGYQGAFRPKQGSPAQQYGFACDGCALFFNKARFTLLQQPRGITFMGTDGLQNKQGMVLMQLLDEQTGRTVLVASTHLKAKPGVVNEAVRLKQVTQALEHLQQAAAQLQQQPQQEESSGRHGEGNNSRARVAPVSEMPPLVFLCGDFNTPPGSAVFSTAQEHALRLRNVWDLPPLSWNGVPWVPPFTTWKFRPEGQAKETIDHILYSDDVSLQAVERWSMPTAEEIGECGLPSWQYASDHVAMCCVFAVQPQQ